MSRLFVKRAAFAVLGGFAAVSVLIALAAEFNGSGLERFYSLGAVEWAIPIIVGASIGMFAWLVLSGLSQDGMAPPHGQAACPACGRPILDDWRLCPECGTLVEQNATIAGDSIPRD